MFDIVCDIMILGGIGMIDEKAKYLIVKATDITKQLYQNERVAYCNDFYNIHHRTEKIDANKIFDKNNVPEEFRLIIVKISSQIFSKKEAEEYIVGFPFDFTTKTIEKIDNKEYIKMNNSPIYYDESVFEDKIVFKTEKQYTSFNNVMYLLEEMYKEGCLENYLQSIKEFFGVYHDLELLFDAWHQTHGKQKTLKLYKSKIFSRSIYY